MNTNMILYFYVELLVNVVQNLSSILSTLVPERGLQISKK
jgi:hypothetical protein